MTEMQFKVVLVNVDLGAHITEKSSIAFLQVKLDPGTPTIYSELGFFSLSLSSVWLHPTGPPQKGLEHSQTCVFLASSPVGSYAHL